MNSSFADLHLHTVASDGTQTVYAMVARARASGLSTVAITDHDAISSELVGRSALLQGVNVITGVELKADFDGVSGELLGYFADPAMPRLVSLLERMERARDRRMRLMLEKCRDVGLEVEMDDVRRQAQGNLGRPHLARALVENGTARDTDDAFDRFIGRGRPCFVPIEKVGFREAIETLHAAGGAVSLAHPCLMRVENWDEFLAKLADARLDALELVYVYRPSQTVQLSISPPLLAARAEEYSFLTTGGSDDHGLGSSKVTLGQVLLPHEHVAALRERASLAR